MSATCKSCGAPIKWIVNKRTLRRMPLDPLPMVVTGTRFYVTGEKVIHDGQELAVGEACTGDRAGYVSHFATCRNADRHRRRRAA